MADSEKGLFTSEAMSILPNVKFADLSPTKDVFVSALRFALSINSPCSPFGDELQRSAQEQVDYMLRADADASLVITDDEVKSVLKTGLFRTCASFERELSSLLLDSDLASQANEDKILRTLSDLEWICTLLPKMNLMKDFVSNWIEISGNVLKVIEDEKLNSLMWGLKVKLIEMTNKALEAVGYGTVILPSPYRLSLLKIWLPYIRKMKPLLDSKCIEETNFHYRMDDELCMNIEGAIVSMVLALPSNDQAGILADWMKAEEIQYPDLTDAFELWCYRTKSAKRRLVEGIGGASSDDGDDAAISF
ncbi:unnamed protein product [Citrullus colocynthis]|uniref:BTB/POZ domain-containing protein n=1 Tax=Citrullus colocynthis TaxID=252529 RepID=A0ABP0XTL0_9ROSI